MSTQDAWYYATPEGERAGPVSYQELRERIQSGLMSREDLVWASHLSDWAPLESVPGLSAWARMALPPANPIALDVHAQHAISQIRTLEIISAVVWSLIAGLQLFVALVMWGTWAVVADLDLFITIGMNNVEAFVLLLMGLFNAYAALSRFRMARLIEQRRKVVVSRHEGLARLIVIGLINLLFGMVIGALWVIFDFVIRDRVLKNRHLFDQ